VKIKRFERKLLKEVGKSFTKACLTRDCDIHYLAEKLVIPKNKELVSLRPA